MWAIIPLKAMAKVTHRLGRRMIVSRMRDSSTPLFSATLTTSRTTSTTASGGKDATLSSAESIAYFRPSVDSRFFTSTTSPDSGSVTATPVTDTTQLTTPSRTAMIQNSQQG